MRPFIWEPEMAVDAWLASEKKKKKHCFNHAKTSTAQFGWMGNLQKSQQIHGVDKPTYNWGGATL